VTPAEATHRQAELALLSQAMLATTINPEKIDRIRPEDFSDERHKFIWRAISEEIRDGGSDCPSLVAVDRLRRAGDLEIAGGAEYIESFASWSSTRIIASFDKAAEAVLECSRLRRISTIAKEVAFSADGFGSSSALSGLKIALDAIDQNKETKVRPALHALTHNLEDAFRSGVRTATPLDRRIALTPGRMYIIGGRPGHGKTTLTLQIVLHMLTHNPDATALFASCEMTEVELALKALCCLDGRDFITPLRAGAGVDLVQMATVTQSPILERLFVKPCRSIDEVCADAHRLHRSQPLQCVVVDYLSAFSAPAGTVSETRSREVGAVSRECKALAQRLDCVVIAASQLNRASKAQTKPALIHLRDSGEIEQDSDGVMLLHRPDHDDDDDATAQLLIAKNRWGELGALDLVPDLANHRFGWSAKRHD